MNQELKKCGIFLLINLIVAVSGYAGIPDWFISHKHPKYPNSRFIVGVGVGNTREAAIERARADIVSQIEIKISSVTEISDYEIDTEAGTKVQLSISSTIKSEAKQVLSGIQIVEVKESKGRFYALAVLDKVRYTKKLLGEISRFSREIDKLKESALTLMEKGKFKLAIAEFDTIFDMVPGVLVRNGVYSAITGNTVSQVEEYSPQRISSELKSLLSNVTLKILSPVGETFILGRNIEPPLSVKAVFLTGGEEIGLEGMPLVLEYETGEIVREDVTNSHGLCSFYFVAVPTGTDNKTGKVRVKFDAGRLPELITDYLRGMYVEYSYTVETPVDSFSLHITDTGGSHYPDFERYLKQRLSEFGIKVSGSSNYVIEGRVIVTGDKEIRTPLARMAYVELVINLEIQNKSGGSVVSTTKVKTSGIGKSYYDAIKAAIKNARVDRVELARFVGKVFK